MGFSTNNTDALPSGSAAERSSLAADPSAETDALEDSLRRLRSRQLMMDAVYGASQASTNAAPTAPDAPASGEEEQPQAAKIDEETLTGPAFNFEAAFDDLRQEIRRLGRELFKTNRTAEGNQEAFAAALAEIQRLSEVITQIPEQSAESVREARFDAKASLCRDLLRLADTAQASLSAADELIARLQRQSEQSASGFVFRFAAARRMRDSLAESVAAMRQWRDGQALLVGRVEAILQAAGARALETVGRAFDPALHRAVSTVARRDVAAGTITAEELKGYTLEGRILRYAEVVVAKHE